MRETQIPNAFISTHTPVRVWQRFCQECDSKRYFNSHTREGATERCFIQVRLSIFQLTHPWGCDLRDRLILSGRTDFNSHTREGVTPLPVALPLSLILFQLTHPWGCDANVWPKPTLICISTHTPVRVWHYVFSGWQYLFHFNSHTREGVTLSG